MSSTYDSTLGALYLGVVLSGILYGVTCLQTWTYYCRYNEDRVALKLLVAAVWSLESLHQAFTTYAVYCYAVTNFPNPSFLATIQWAIVAEVIVTGLVALTVQLFFVYRIYRLSQCDWQISGFVSLLAIGQFSIYSAYCVKAYQFTTFTQLTAKLPTLSCLVNATTVITDVAITIIICFYLQKSRTGINSTDSMINKLIIYSVTTGLLTSIDSICTLVTYLAARYTFIYIFFFLILSRLYSNSLMATLNRRTSLEDCNTTAQDRPSRHKAISIPSYKPSQVVELQDIQCLEPPHSCGSTLEIKVNTTCEVKCDSPVIHISKEAVGSSITRTNLKDDDGPYGLWLDTCAR